MNITKDIHLSHVKFTMDDEAYKILKSYLDKLTIAFSSNSSKNEILKILSLILQNYSLLIILLTE